MKNHELWTQVTIDLERARRTIPASADNDATILQYQEFLEHNELSLACEMLETYAEGHPVSRYFWVALGDAAVKMRLLDKATLYRAQAERNE